MKYLLGYDIGSSSVKAALVTIENGSVAGTTYSPRNEMTIDSPRPGFAEQDPETWWNELINATRQLKEKVNFQPDEVAAIGVSYQMHGLVCIDKSLKPLRPSIIWCDSRAVEIGREAFEGLGKKFCLTNLLNSPSNFTACKLKWVKENETEVYKKIHKVMLPGDYIALKLTGDVATTVSGLSEGIFWNFKKNKVSKDLLEYLEIDKSLLSPVIESFSGESRLNAQAAEVLGLKDGIPVSYRAGDQPNNAYSLNVLEPGEIAATAGTSGVVYGISDKPVYDKKSRVNTFVHVNHSEENPRYGVLLCINGTGILNSWMRKNFFGGLSYDEINAKAASAPLGSEGIRLFPFGNGAERILENNDLGAWMEGLQFNRHNASHVARAGQEGIVFAMNYGVEIMRDMDMEIQTVRAGYSNMFLSEVFASTFANSTGCTIELYNTDGAVGAARAAGVGARVYKNFAESFAGMEMIKKIDPDPELQKQTMEIYEDWKHRLKKRL